MTQIPQKLTKEQRKQFFEALLSAYTTISALKQMVSLRLDKNLEDIGGTGLREIAYNLIKDAEEYGYIQELISQACQDRPNNLNIRTLIEQYHISIDTSDSEDTTDAPTDGLDSPIEPALNSLFVSEADRENRRRILEHVRSIWIEGGLRKSLWNQARLLLNLQAHSDAVLRPGDLALRRAGESDTPIPPGTSILDVFQKQKELLLLGQPGSGKSTLLLEITESLLQEAERNPQRPIPVVFDLSAWRKGHKRLGAWLVEQLDQFYRVPVPIGSKWVKSGALILLLDGLDEIAEDRRAACAEAINDYRQNYQTVLRPMVVCCRTQEYEAIPKLRLSGAVVIQPLTQQQVDDYLSVGGKPLGGLRRVLKDEPTLYRELFSTPLMLHVAILAYAGQSAIQLRQKVSIEERRRRLWDAYIEQMFVNKQEAKPQYEKAQALDWLAWLGKYLTRKDLQQYLVEGMQPDDLPRPWQALLVRLLLPIILVSIISILVRMFYPSYIVVATVVILFVFLVSYSRDIRIEPKWHFAPRNIRQHRRQILTKAAVGAALVGTLYAVPVTFGGELYAIPLAAAFGAAIGGTIGATAGTLVALFEQNMVQETVRPNDGIRYSLRISAFVLVLVLGFLAGLGALYEWAYKEMSRSVYYGAVAGIIAGSVFAVWISGKSVFQHYLLRLLLWQSGRFPRNITAFLDWTAQRALVQRVGGGWRFVHRTLQERFAERYDDSHQAH